MYSQLPPSDPSGAHKQAKDFKPKLQSSLNGTVNTLLFHSKCFQFTVVVGDFLSNCKGTVILIDFCNNQLEAINRHMSRIKVDKLLTNIKLPAEAYTVSRLNQMTIQKRKIAYLQLGSYACTSLVLLQDLLKERQMIDLRLISRVLIRCREKITSNHSNLPWLSTLLRIKNPETVLTILTDCVHFYRREEELQGIYRAFFCKKVVIWPFGRSEIQELLKVGPRARQIEYGLTMTELQIRIHTGLSKLLSFLQLRYERQFHIKLDFLTLMNQESKEHASQLSQPRYAFHEFSDLSSLKKLFTALLNCNPISFLNQMHIAFSDPNPRCLWSCNSSTVLESITQIDNYSRARVFRVGRIEGPSIPIDLIPLLVEEENSLCEYEAIYELGYFIQLKFQQAAKFSSIIQIIRKISEDCQKEFPNKPCEWMEEALIKEKFGVITKQILILSSSSLTSRELHLRLFQHTAKVQYVEYLREVYCYLERCRAPRLKKIRQIVERIKIKKGTFQKLLKPKSKGEQLRMQTESILMEQIYLELRSLFELLTFCESKDIKIGCVKKQSYHLQQQSQMSHSLVYQRPQNLEMGIKEKIEPCQGRKYFESELQKLEFKYIKKQMIKIPPPYELGCDLKIEVGGVTIQLAIISGSIERNYNPITRLNQVFSLLNPQHCIFMAQKASLLRNILIHKALNTFANLEAIYILKMNESIEEKAMQTQITSQDSAFWQLSKNRGNLPSLSESPYARITSLFTEDDLEETARTFNRDAISYLQKLDSKSKETKHTNLLKNYTITVKRKVLVDSREFKSGLPSLLFHFGFEVIPTFLETGDYILSEEVGVEKKSVHTKDLQLSLRSGRLQSQLRRMSSIFKKPYLLIECEGQAVCKKEFFLTFDSEYRRSSLRVELMRLLIQYPKIKIIWSTSLKNTCEIFKDLKQGGKEPELQRFQKKNEAAQKRKASEQDKNQDFRKKNDEDAEEEFLW